ALAWDVGTGSGQGAKLLSPFFDRVVATDASKQQLEHAVPVSNVTYYQANEEKSGLAKGHFLVEWGIAKSKQDRVFSFMY
ncbi:MAG: methyltransferase domain-containing protein, partial [Arenicellales bacterium]|nr:methyltransferase domain-containing protein [Arenicellales bacterium]